MLLLLYLFVIYKGYCKQPVVCLGFLLLFSNAAQVKIFLNIFVACYETMLQWGLRFDKVP